MWQLAQPALPANNLNPSTSWRISALSSPSIQRSNRVGGGHQRALVGRDRLGQIFVADFGVLGKRLGKCAYGIRGRRRAAQSAALSAAPSRPATQSGQIPAARDFWRARPRTPDAHHARFPRSVCGGRAAGPDTPVPLDVAVSESFVSDVTGRARRAAVDGEALVVKQFFAEVTLLIGESIVGRERHLRGPTNAALSAARSSAGCATGAASTGGGRISSAAPTPTAPPATNAAASRQLVTCAGTAFTSACRRQAQS